MRRFHAYALALTILAICTATTTHRSASHSSGNTTTTLHPPTIPTIPTMPTLADYKAPYPEPTADQKRFVIFLDKKENEDEMYKLEIIPGRVEMVDGANHHFMGGELEQQTVQGWGYDYYVATLGPTAGTLMMPIGPAAEKRPRFVASSAATIMRYNSKLPVVVYVPKDATVRYRIWSAQGGMDGVAAEEH